MPNKITFIYFVLLLHKRARLPFIRSLAQLWKSCESSNCSQPRDGIDARQFSFRSTQIHKKIQFYSFRLNLFKLICQKHFCKFHSGHESPVFSPLSQLSSNAHLEQLPGVPGGRIHRNVPSNGRVLQKYQKKASWL